MKAMLEFLLHNLPIHVVNLLTGILPPCVPTNRVRGLLIRPFLGGRSNAHLQVASGCILNKPKRLVCGKGVYISYNCYINAVGNIRLEDGVIIGPMCVLASSKHLFQRGQVTNTGSSKPIIIGKGAWLASHVVVNGGVTIGEGCIIAANAVVTEDIPPSSFAAGVPARVIRRLDGE